MANRTQGPGRGCGGKWGYPHPIASVCLSVGRGGAGSSPSLMVLRAGPARARAGGAAYSTGSLRSTPAPVFSPPRLGAVCVRERVSGALGWNRGASRWLSFLHRLRPSAHPVCRAEPTRAALHIVAAPGRRAGSLRVLLWASLHPSHFFSMPWPKQRLKNRTRLWQPICFPTVLGMKAQSLNVATTPQVLPSPAFSLSPKLSQLPTACPRALV